MRHWLFTAFALLALWAATAARETAAPSQDAARSARVDALFLRHIGPDTPGCAVGVYRRGQTVLARGYGVANIEDGRPITPHSTFNLGSASKPFTALAALILEQHGQLSLNDDVRRWVPELPDYGVPIRVRDLLQHTSGLRDFQTLQLLAGRSVTTQPELIGLIAGQRALNFEPGTRHEYSHSDFGVLGVIIERIAGVPFGAHMQQAVFEPLGMKATFVDDCRKRSSTLRAFGHLVSPSGPSVLFPDTQTFGGDNVYASVEDLARWDRNFNKPRLGGAAIDRMRWQIEPRGPNLALRRRGQRELTLRAIAPDQFLRGFGPDGETSARLQFHRDNARRVTGLTLSTPPGDDAVSNLQFIRQPAK